MLSEVFVHHRNIPLGFLYHTQVSALSDGSSVKLTAILEASKLELMKVSRTVDLDLQLYSCTRFKGFIIGLRVLSCVVLNTDTDTVLILILIL